MTNTSAGRIVPAAVISIGNIFWQLLGGDQGRLVAAQAGLRGQRVHALGAAEPRHQLQRERAHVSLGQVGERLVGHVVRPQQSNDDLALAVGVGLGVGRPEPLDLENHLGRLEHRVAVGNDVTPDRLVLGVAHVRPLAGAGRDQHLVAVRD
jgi:hypothetical protein